MYNNIGACGEVEMVFPLVSPVKIHSVVTAISDVSGVVD